MSATILLFPHHRLHGPRCQIPDCSVCNGGLAWCETCGGAEGDLPSECPQERMTDKQRLAVYRGQADFLGGRWVEQVFTGAMTMGLRSLPADTFPEHPLLHHNCRCVLTLHVDDPDAG